MENLITVDGLTFEPYITRDEIQKQVKRVAEEIKSDMKGRAPLFVCVLNGAFMFAADLIRECGINDSHIAFVRYKSYEGTASSGKVKEVMGLTEDIEGRDVVIIEDIVDTGESIEHMIKELEARNPASVEVCTLFFKPGSYRKTLPIKYRAMEIGNEFIVGYGLDYDQLGRSLKDIYVVTE